MAEQLGLGLGDPWEHGKARTATAEQEYGSRELACFSREAMRRLSQFMCARAEGGCSCERVGREKVKASEWGRTRSMKNEKRIRR